MPARTLAEAISAPDPSFRTEKEVARKLRISDRTLQRHRANGTGPRFLKLGRRILYADPDVDEWTAENRFTSTAQAHAQELTKIARLNAGAEIEEGEPAARQRKRRQFRPADRNPDRREVDSGHGTREGATAGEEI
jgi:hypothetical protein